MPRKRTGNTVDCTAHNIALRELWREWIASGSWPKALGSPLWPAQYPPMREDLPLFVGMNPSYGRKRDKAARIRGPKDLRSDDRACELVENERRALGLDGSQPYRYFRKFGQIVNHLDGYAAPPLSCSERTWNHVDTLAVRWNSQRELERALGIDKNGETRLEYVQRQIVLTQNLIDALRPRIVVVVNALASTILKAALGGHLRWDAAAGCDIRKVRGRTVPWIFSGMLTGQRALDNHTVRLLTWHVGHALRTCAM